MKDSDSFTVPYSLEIEQALLSILLHNNQSYESLPDFLRPEHFYAGIHQTIFHAIRVLIHKGKLANPLTLGPYLAHQEQDKNPQGTESDGAEYQNYLTELAGLMVPARNAADYGGKIYDFFLRRQLVTLGEEITHEARNPDIEAPEAYEQIEHIESRLFSLCSQQQQRGALDFSSALAQAITSAQLAYQRDSHVVGVTTGFLDMDKMLGGLHPSDLIILAGRPSMGKTALATNIAFNAAISKLKSSEKGGGSGVAFFSLEMSAMQLALRLLGQETGISSDRIRRGAIDKSAFPSFVDLARDLAQLPLFIDDTPALSIGGLLSRARRLIRKEKVGLIVIDYLQLLTTGKNNNESRVQELSEITRGLKGLAKQLEVPVLALSQLSRAVEQREDKRPMLADLRESGTIEQDADVVMFVYREEYYESRNKPQEGSDKMLSWQQHMSEIYNQAEIIVAKQRHGPIGSVFLQFDGQKTKFSNAAPKMSNTIN